MGSETGGGSRGGAFAAGRRAVMISCASCGRARGPAVGEYLHAGMKHDGPYGNNFCFLRNASQGRHGPLCDVYLLVSQVKQRNLAGEVRLKMRRRLSFVTLRGVY